MGSKNLKQRSVSFAKDIPKNVKSKLVGFKGTVIGFIEKLVGRPITAASKKKAAMSITRRPEYIRQVVHRETIVAAEPVIEVLTPVAEPETVVAETVREIPVLIEIQDSLSCSTSIEVPVTEEVTVAETVPETDVETVEVQEDLFDDGFDAMRVYGIGALAATSSAAAPTTSTAPFVMDFDDWDLETESSVSKDEPVQAVVEESIPVAEESAEEKAFFEDLYDEIIARCLYEDVLPSMIPEYYAEIEYLEGLYKDLATESVVNDVLPKLVPELFGTAVTSEISVAETVDAEQTIPVVAPVPVIETVPEMKVDEAEIAFFEKLYSDIEAYIIFNDILPQIQEEEKSVPDYVISDIGSNESAETQIEIPAAIVSPLEKFVNGAASFSFGYSKSSETAGPTKFSFIMGVPEETSADDEYEENVRSNAGAEAIMAASQQNSRLYL